MVRGLRRECNPCQCLRVAIAVVYSAENRPSHSPHVHHRTFRPVLLNPTTVLNWTAQLKTGQMTFMIDSCHSSFKPFVSAAASDCGVHLQVVLNFAPSSRMCRFELACRRCHQSTHSWRSTLTGGTPSMQFA